MHDMNALSNEIIGAHSWAVTNGAEAISLLNASGAHADVEVTILFSDREPAGPYKVVVPALRLLRLRFDELDDPEPIPRDTTFAAVIESDEPIVVQPAFPQPANWVHFLSELPKTQTLQ
jgi:hypothetical protein